MDQEHCVYKGTWIEGSSLQSVTATLLDLGFDVSSPVGILPPKFVLMLKSNPTAKLAEEWVSISAMLSQNSNANDDDFEDYCELLLGGFRLPSRSFDVFAFGSGGFMSSQLAHLVAKGRKRMTAGWLRAQVGEGLPLPAAGGQSIVTDGYGIPICLIQGLKVQRLAFCDVTAEMAEIEGEGDLSLEDWKSGHFSFFSSESEESAAGVPFSESEEIFVETFQVLKVFGNQDLN